MLRLSWLALFLFCIEWFAPDVMAGSGQTLILPSAGTKVRSGLRMTIDTNWVAGAGYRPVVVRISPIAGGAAVADRYLDVVVRPRGWYGGHRAGSATATVHLPQGATVGEVVIDVPQTNSWSMLDVESYEDGRFLPDLSGKRMGMQNRFYNDSYDGTPSILVLSPHAVRATGSLPISPLPRIANSALVATPSLIFTASSSLPGQIVSPILASMDPRDVSNNPNKLPDIRALASCFPLSYVNGYVTADRFLTNTAISDPEIQRLVNELPFLDLVRPSELPDHWLSYSGVDVIVAHFDEISSLAQQDPERWQALRTWLSTGTTLCVYGAGEGFSRLPELDAFFDLPSGGDQGDAASSAWAIADVKHHSDTIGFLSDSNNNSWWQQQAKQLRNAHELQSQPPAADPSKFRFRTIGAGNVVALAEDYPFPGTVYDWSWMFNNLSPRSWLWTQRHGISYQRDNPLFWNFLLGDIGRAPVFSFITLITLFAIVIGPVNYYFLHRKGHLYLLLVTVPLGALLVTGTLMAYATFADGLGARCRIRSFTRLDQPRQEAVSWSRHLYYAGLAPSRGLVFPRDAAVYPIDYRPLSGFGNEDTDRSLVWGNEQNLVTGYFVSRTASQLLVVEPRQSELGLRVTAQDEGPPVVVNELGTTVQSLLLCDNAGSYFTGARTSPGGTVSLTPANRGEEASRLKSLLGTHRLEFPEGFNVNNIEDVSGMFVSSAYYNSYAPVPTLDTSLLENSIREWLTDPMLHLKPGGYLAVTDRPPFVSKGVDSAEEKEGFHVIAGRW